MSKFLLPSFKAANNSTASIKTNENGEEVVNLSSSYMIYYLLGGIYIRPVGFIDSGYISSELPNKPYHLRRSSGEIQIVPYESTNFDMKTDCEYILGKSVSKANSRYLKIKVKQGSRLHIFGELFGGYILEGEASVTFNGHLCLAFRSLQENGSLVEEGLFSNPQQVEVTSGFASLYVCDQKDLVMLYSGEGTFNVELPQKEVAQEKVVKDLALLKRISEEAKLEREVAAASLTDEDNLRLSLDPNSSVSLFQEKVLETPKSLPSLSVETYQQKLGLISSLQQEKLFFTKSASSYQYQNKMLPKPLVIKSKSDSVKSAPKSVNIKKHPTSVFSFSRTKTRSNNGIPDKIASGRSRSDLVLMQSSIGNLDALKSSAVPAPFENIEHNRQFVPVTRTVSTRALQSTAVQQRSSPLATTTTSALFPQTTGDVEMDDVLRQIAQESQVQPQSSNCSLNSFQETPSIKSNIVLRKEETPTKSRQLCSRNESGNGNNQLISDADYKVLLGTVASLVALFAVFYYF